MPRKPRTERRRQPSAMVPHAFLRSINIQLDVAHPERFEHFRPTSKSVRLVSALLERGKGKALFGVAPYGSGKSISAGYLGHVIDNAHEADEMLGLIEGRLGAVSPALRRKARHRRRSGARGLFVPLYGYANSAPVALKHGILDAMRRAALGRQARTIDGLRAQDAGDVPGLLESCADKLQQSGRDRLVIVWDEFGRHLQGLVSEGRPEELDVLQMLAEVTSRSSSVPVSLVLLLHRSLLGYAAGLAPGLRREWAKIEGRFETLQYVDDSNEVYELVASLVEEDRPATAPRADFGRLAANAKRVGMFPDMADERLAAALASAYPLSPATLYLLPRVAARVAQNERTLFSFLQWASLDAPVKPDALYEYFRGDFRNDGGAGGTQRPWLETESALGKVPGDSAEAGALKTAFLLSLGLSGERSHATCEQLAFAMEEGNDGDDSGVRQTIDRLVEANLLVHRRHSDQVVVWHGTDVDLRGRLEDEKKRYAADFDLAAFLTREMPPAAWRPVEYNARRGVRRYLEAGYTTVAGLEAFLDNVRLVGWEPGTDGRVLYVLPADEHEAAQAETLASGVDDLRLFIAVAREVSALRNAAVDLWCLLRMHADQDMIGSDPLVGAELDHLTDDARAGLQPLVDRVLHPQPNGSRWFYKGDSVRARNVTELRRVLSQAMEDVFPHTPEIDLEMVVRRSPTPIVVNARKKVELGLLERYGQEDLGIEGNFADKAIFRCVFLRTGLYCQNGRFVCQNDSVSAAEQVETCQNGRTWTLAAPEDLESGRPGLAAVWGHIRAFFTEPGTDKSLRTLLDELKEPPFGVREGLLPLFIAAAFRAFPTAATVRRLDRFVDDLLPSVVEDMAKHPDKYALDVVGISSTEETYLAGVRDLFGGDGHFSQDERDLFRACMAAVLDWRQTLPAGVATSRSVSAEARSFLEELDTPDPVALFLDRLPQLIGATPGQPEQMLRGVARLKDEMESVGTFFRDEAVRALSQALTARGATNGLGTVNGAAANPNGTGVRGQAVTWAGYFPKSFTRHLPDQITKGVLTRLGSRYKDDGALVNALSTLLVGLPIGQWDDAALPAFRRKLHNAFDLIETKAVELSRDSVLASYLEAWVTVTADARVRQVAEQLADALGREEAAKRLEATAASLREQPSATPAKTTAS